MRSSTRKLKSSLLTIIIGIIILSCNRSSNLENEITIKINSVNLKDKRPRINIFDTIEIRKEGVGYLMRTFDKVGEFTTDSTGSAKIKIDKTEDYKILLRRRNYF